MIRRHKIMSALAATIVLSSCSGGDDASPSPTPTATPTPTPTASPTYAAFPLTTATEFFTINAATSYTGDPAGAVTLGTAVSEALTTRVRLATTPAFGTSTSEYVIRDNTEESRFVPANATTPPAAANTEFVFRTTDTATAGKFSQLEFLNNTIPPLTTGGAAVVTSDPLLGSLKRVSYANWWRGDSTAGQKRLTSTIWGYSTVATDVPTTGTQAYTTRIAGRLVSSTGAVTTINRVSGTVTFSINFSTGQVDATLVLTQGATGTEAPFTTIALQGAIPAGSNQYSGAFTSGSPLTGQFNGACFGSVCTETGLTFAGQGTIGATSYRLVGVVIGKKS